MQDGKTLVFIDLRLRTSRKFVTTARGIMPLKQQKLILTTQHFLQQHGDCNYRLDSILVRKAYLQFREWLRNAIDA